MLGCFEVGSLVKAPVYGWEGIPIRFAYLKKNIKTKKSSRT